MAYSCRRDCSTDDDDTAIVFRSRGTIHLLAVDAGSRRRRLSVIAPQRKDKRVKELVQTLRQVNNDMEEAAAEAMANQLLIFRDVYVPLLEKLGTLHESTSGSKKKEAFASLLGSALGKVQEFLSSGEVRVTVNYYRLQRGAGGRRFLAVTDRTAFVARPRLDDSTPEGREILERVLAGQDAYVDDLGEGTAERERAYNCYASIAVRLNGQVHGMLSANTPVPNGLLPTSVDFLRSIGALMAAAESQLGLSEPASVRHLQ